MGLEDKLTNLERFVNYSRSMSLQSTVTASAAQA